MKFYNFFGMSRKKLNECKRLLDKEYLEIDIPVYIVPRTLFGKIISIWFYKKYQSLTVKEAIQKINASGGITLYNTWTYESIAILCNQTSEKYNMFTFFHEIRHSYQQTYLKEWHEKFSYHEKTEDFLSSNLQKYKMLPLEWDANNYARTQMKILGYKFNQYNTFEIIEENK